MSAETRPDRQRYDDAAFLTALRAAGTRDPGPNGMLVATTAAVAAEVGCSRSTARRRLARLADGVVLGQPFPSTGEWQLAPFADHRRLLEATQP